MSDSDVVIRVQGLCAMWWPARPSPLLTCGQRARVADLNASFATPRSPLCFATVHESVQLYKFKEAPKLPWLPPEPPSCPAGTNPAATTSQQHPAPPDPARPATPKLLTSPTFMRLPLHSTAAVAADRSESGQQLGGGLHGRGHFGGGVSGGGSAVGTGGGELVERTAGHRRVRQPAEAGGGAADWRRFERMGRTWFGFPLSRQASQPERTPLPPDPSNTLRHQIPHDLQP